jgi:hypothetical protein
MKINLRVTYESGSSEEVVCSAIDLVKFETEYNLSVTRLEKEMKLTHLLFLAHASLFRQAKTKSSFDAWVETVSSIDASGTDPK